ncbi:MAG: VTT domain-containing protein [Deltaproteobacteria bacterium]|nr:VTT domain-containing protein [Deltaproteobacteria bacterium]
MNKLKGGSLIVVLVVLASAALKLDLFAHLVTWAEAARGLGLVGVLGGMAAIIGCTLLLMPLNPLMALAGWIWGWWGILICIPPAVTSASIAFLLTRRFAQSAVAQSLKVHPKVAQVFTLAERGGVVTVALLRVSLLVPFTPGNAALGLTQLKLKDLMLGTFLGMLVPVVAFVGLGMVVPDAEALRRGEFMPPARSLAMGGAGLVLMLGIGALVARKLRAKPGDLAAK